MKYHKMPFATHALTNLGKKYVLGHSGFLEMKN
jgi:hypothetical protein